MTPPTATRAQLPPLPHASNLQPPPLPTHPTAGRYAAWLADPSVTPRTYIYSYIGMAIATLGQLWAPARLLGGPPPQSVQGGCCGKTGCCVPLEGEEELSVVKAAAAATTTTEVVLQNGTPDQVSALS